MSENFTLFRRYAYINGLFFNGFFLARSLIVDSKGFFIVGKLYTSKTIAISCKRQNAMESYTCETWHGDCYM